MSDIYPKRSCSELLQDLTMLVRRHIASAREMQLDILAGLHAQLRDAHRMALTLEARARDAAELEAIARDIELTMVPDALAPDVVLPEPLARLVAHHERELDAEDATRVVSISRYRKPRLVCGGPDDGDAA